MDQRIIGNLTLTSISKKSLGFIIAEIRSKRHLTQKQLANFSGITQSYLSKLEQGLQQPTLESLEKIAISLGVPLPILIYMAFENERKSILSGDEETNEFVDLIFENYNILSELYLKLSEKEFMKNSERNETITEIKEDLKELRTLIEGLSSSVKKAISNGAKNPVFL